MYSLVERYITNLTKEKIKVFALEKEINFTDQELDFVYKFIKKNWQTIYASHGKFDLTRYKINFSEENFQKLVVLYKEYLTKYASLL